MSAVPELRAALVRAAERQAGSRPQAAWRGRLGGVGIALAGAVAVAVVAVVIAFGGSGPRTGSPAVTTGLPTQAWQAANALLAQAPKLPGAVTVLTDPSTPAAHLGALPNGLQADHVFDVHRFFVVRMSEGQVIDTFTRHARSLQRSADTSSGEAESVSGSAAASGSAGPHGSQTVWQSYGFNLPATGRILRLLAIQVAAARGGGTAVRIDAQAGWDSPRPDSSLIAAGAHRIDVRLYGLPGRNTPTERTIGTAQARAVVAWLNALPQAPPAGDCWRVGSDAQLSIEGAHGQLARATLSLTCGSVRLGVPGQPPIGLSWAPPDDASGPAIARTARMFQILTGYSYLQLGAQTGGQTSGTATSSSTS